MVMERKIDDGIGYLQAAAFLDPELPGPYRLLGATYLKMGRSQTAERHLAEYLRIRPDGPLARDYELVETFGLVWGAPLEVYKRLPDR